MTWHVNINATPIAVVADVLHCKKVLKEMDGSCTWMQAWNLHKLRIFSHRLLEVIEKEEDDS